MSTRTRAERETVIQFDETDELACLSTFSRTQARRWIRAGVDLTRRGDEWRGRAPYSSSNSPGFGCCRGAGVRFGV